MNAPVELYFDYASPWAYLACELLEKKLPGVAVAWRPIYLRGLEMFSKGIPFTPNKLRYLTRDWTRCLEREGVPGKLPSVFPVNGLYAVRGAFWTLAHGGFESYHRRLFRAAWAEGRNVSGKDEVIVLAAEAGLDREAFAQGIESPETKEGLRRQTEEAQQRGVFGVPTFAVGGELFWGHDRMEHVRWWLGRKAG